MKNMRGEGGALKAKHYIFVGGGGTVVVLFLFFVLFCFNPLAVGFCEHV